MEGAMQRAKRFEELVAWQKARVLTKAIYAATDTRPLAEDRSLGRQMQRAAVSVMSNIAEGYERGGLREFHRYICIAKASCTELRSQLYVAMDTGRIPANQFFELSAKADETARVLGGLRVAVKRVLGASP